MDSSVSARSSCTISALIQSEGLVTLCIEGILSLLVLGNFVGLVLLALLAESPAGLRHVHLDNEEH